MNIETTMACPKCDNYENDEGRVKAFLNELFEADIKDLWDTFGEITCETCHTVWSIHDYPKHPFVETDVCACGQDMNDYFKNPEFDMGGSTEISLDPMVYEDGAPIYKCRCGAYYSWVEGSLGFMKFPKDYFDEGDV